MKYFIANGFNPSPHAPTMQEFGYSNITFGPSRPKTRLQMARRYKEAGVPLPILGETIFLRVPTIGRISLFVYGPYKATILIVAPSQKKAYLLGNAFKAVSTCFYGNPPGNNLDLYLLEVGVRPTPAMSTSDLEHAIEQLAFSDEGPDIALELALESGTGLDHVQIKEACRIASEAIAHLHILDALLHLEYSRLLVWGFMVGSFYASHYSRDRRQLTRHQLEGVYLENRFRYDSAFVSAFRGIECVLGTPHFKHHDIATLLEKTDRTYHTTFASSRYRSWHEIFSTSRKWWQYKDLVAHYLKLRNSVSAHGNPSPPHIVMEDQVFEIQYLLQTMLAKILVPEKAR